MAVIGMTALTSAATGWLAEVLPIQTIFWLFGICAMLCGLVGLAVI